MFSLTPVLNQFAEMETGAGIGLYPLHRCKTIYLVSGFLSLWAEIYHLEVSFNTM